MNDDRDREEIDDGWTDPAEPSDAEDAEEPAGVADAEDADDAADAGEQPAAAKPHRTRAKKKKRVQRPTEPGRPLAKKRSRASRPATAPQPRTPARHRRPWLLPLLVFLVVLGALVLALVASKAK